MQALPLEALWLHCNTRNLVQSGTRKVLAEYYYEWLQAQSGTPGTTECQDKSLTQRAKRLANLQLKAKGNVKHMLMGLIGLNHVWSPPKQQGQGVQVTRNHPPQNAPKGNNLLVHYHPFHFFFDEKSKLI